MKEKYPTLRLLSVILKVLAWVVGITTLVIFFVIAIGGTFAGRTGTGGAVGILYVGIEFYSQLCGC